MILIVPMAYDHLHLEGVFLRAGVTLLPVFNPYPDNWFWYHDHWDPEPCPHPMGWTGQCARAVKSKLLEDFPCGRAPGFIVMFTGLVVQAWLLVYTVSHLIDYALHVDDGDCYYGFAHPHGMSMKAMIGSAVVHQ